jgi:hypothetical protein
MSPDEAKQHIVDAVAVRRQQVTLAKAFILKNFQPDTAQLVGQFLNSVDAKMPDKLVLHQSVDTLPNLRAAAEAISWKIAACEAVWGLISNGAIFPASASLWGEIEVLACTTVVPGSGGLSGGVKLDELSVRVPDRLVLPRSSEEDSAQPLTDPDLYLNELDLPDLDSAIETALRQAVQCFRHDLFLACLAMLGRASEAAWIEAGRALAGAAPTGSAVNATKVRDQLEDPFVGIGKKIKAVVDLYSKQDVFGDIAKACGVKPQDLRNCVVWADCVRESRNSIHYGAEPAMSNSYEKVAALMIGAVPHLRVLVSLTSAAKEQPS